MSADDTIKNVEELTHRVHFRKRGVEPALIDADRAEKLSHALGNPEYPRDSSITIGAITCELRDVAMVEKLTQKLIRRGWYRCPNEHCNNENHQHRTGDRCAFDLTGVCADCGAQVTERSREYALYRWGKIMCKDCSPHGKAAKLFPHDGTMEGGRIVGMAAYYIAKGLSDEEVMEKVQSDLGKSSIIGGSKIPVSACITCQHSKYHHTAKGCSDCECKAYEHA